MKGDPKVLKAINELLAGEYAAIHQYMVHAEMGENWGYGKYHDYVQERIADETKHAERLIERSLALGGTPDVKTLDDINIGMKLEAQLEIDHYSEADAISKYRKAITLAQEVGDFKTADIFEDNLSDEEDHIHDIETRVSQIQQLGLENYLTLQVGEEEEDLDEGK